MLLEKRQTSPSLESALRGSLPPNRASATTSPTPVPHTAPPNISNWHIADETGAQIARQTARQRAFRAAASSGLVAPPLALTSDPTILYQEMRKRIAALEETIAKLPTAPGGPLNDNEIDEIKSEIATLKTLPPVPAKPPTEAAGIQSRVASFGEKVLVGLATTAVTEASKGLWAQCGDQLIALARSIGEWIASLPPPP